jgi:hypothetical protein
MTDQRSRKKEARRPKTAGFFQIDLSLRRVV